MKKLQDYLIKSEHWMESPSTGDHFDIELADDTLLETYVMDVAEDGSVLLDSTAEIYDLLESWNMLSDEDTDAALTESHFAVGDRVKCRRSGMTGHVVKLDKDHGADDDRYYTVKRDNGQLRKMAPKDMTKINEAAPLAAMVGGALARQAMGAAIDRKQETKPVNELEMEINPPGQDANEYDQEGDMAKTELHTMIRAARRLIGMLDDDDNMPEWTQKKITKATDYVDTAADYIASQKERGIMENDAVPNPVARAILHRIMMQHTGMLAQYGPEQVMDAVDDVAEYIGDVEEIGTSDVSEYVRAVQQMLGGVRESGVAEQGGFNDDGSYNTSDDEATDFDEYDFDDTELGEAEYQGRKVQLNKKMKGDVAKSKVYVRDPKTGNVKKVNFGDPNMKIRKSNPGARKSFRARHNCDNPGPKTKARYWSCRSW